LVITRSVSTAERRTILEMVSRRRTAMAAGD
jgi:hypothetical protein